jgi:hypothetical protein
LNKKISEKRVGFAIDAFDLIEEFDGNGLPSTDLNLTVILRAIDYKWRKDRTHDEIGIKITELTQLDVQQTSQKGKEVLKNTIKALTTLVQAKKDALALQIGGKKSKKILKKIVRKKIVRKHRGIIQIGGNIGRLKKGFKFSGKRLKSGMPEILKVKSKK